MKKPNKDPLDPEAFALEQQEIEPANTQVLYKMIDEQQWLTEMVAVLAKEQKQVEQVLRRISEEKIPTLATTLGLKKFESPDGLQVEIVEDIKASVSAPHKIAAIAYLRKTGNDALIKEALTVNAQDQDDFEKVSKILTDNELTYESKLTLNTASLKAFVRREIEAGNTDFDPKTFGVFTYRKTVVKKGD